MNQYNYLVTVSGQVYQRHREAIVNCGRRDLSIWRRGSLYLFDDLIRRSCPKRSIYFVVGTRELYYQRGIFKRGGKVAERAVHNLQRRNGI